MRLNLDIFGSIGDEITLADVAGKLSAPGISEIVLRINSDGGVVTEGFAIYNLLAAHPATKHVRVEGLAASIASIIAMVGDTIEMVDGSFMMVHLPFAMTKGNAEELRSTAGTLDKMCSGMVQVYAERTNKSEENILKILENETWMSAAEAVKAGFADKVVTAKGKSMVATNWNLEAYAQVPDAVKQMAELSKATPNTSGENMDEDKVLAKLGELDEKLGKHMSEYGEFCSKVSKALFEEKEEPAEAKAEEPAKEEPAKEEEPAEEAKATAKADPSTLKALADANAEIQKMAAKLAAITRDKFEAKVSDAIKAGKLLPSQKAWALSVDETSFDQYLAAVGDAVFPVSKEHKEDLEKTSEVVAELTKEELKLAEQMGHSKEALIAYNKSHPKKG